MSILENVLTALNEWKTKRIWARILKQEHDGF
jgi:hypothetical protein